MKQIPRGSNEVTTSDNLPESVTTKAEEADIPDDRYEGYTFRILGAALAAGQTANDIISDAETGDALGDAVYKRNRMAEDITGSTNIWDDIINIFREGRALYRISIMGDIVGLRDMEDDFGILPLPKYDENQESYITTYQAWNGSAYMVPASISDSKRTAAILEYMAYLSKDTITDAYYNVNLQGKVARDDDSSEMLDIIFDSMKTDVGFAFQLGGVQDVLKGIINSDTDNTASTLASSKESIVTAIKDFEESAKG